MRIVRVLKPALVLLASVAISACGVIGPREAGFPAAQTATPRFTATPTQTATPTPTPTPTAPPAVVSGDPRSLTLAEPVRQNGAPCGFVDTLDFPLDPPDGATASGGGDFNRFRERYNGYHAGEDWRFGRSTSFGRPVFSIGHGRVIYAQPLGWGADKGVVIVEHSFRSGRRILSFYGHLDPPSVTMRPGACVERGDQIGNIGDPRTSPHLHFEMRVHLPDTPGPGYWPSDPRRVGWRPPSATIWHERMAALPGVRWSILRDDAALSPLGVVDGSLLVASAAGELLALDPIDGGILWSHAWDENPRGLLLDSPSRLIYLAAVDGAIEAYSTSALARGGLATPAWRLESAGFGLPAMAVLPGGGLVVATGSAMLGVSLQGEVLWSREPGPAILDWAETGSGLVALDRNRLWTMDADGASSWPLAMSGQRIVASDQPFVYADDGLYCLDLDARTADLVYALPSGQAQLGDLAELPGGGHLLLHTDPADSRLLAFDADGSLRWERSVADLGASSGRLLVAGGRVFLQAQIGLGNTASFDILDIAQEDGALTRLFSGGTRASGPAPVDAVAAGDTLMITVPGVGLFAWDPQAALEAILGG